MRAPLLVAAIALIASASSSSAQTSVIYGGITGATPTFTGSTPRTYMGQAFNVADPGVAVAITQLRITMVAGVALNYADSQLRIQFWDTFNPAATGTALAFSNPVGSTLIFDTGAVNTTGATAITFTLNFATPIMLTGLTNHGIVVNWQSDAAGTGTFIDDTNLTAALRTGAGATAPPPLTAGSNANPAGTTYFRNASGLTTMNLQANDARNIANVSGLMFELTAVSVPEPSTYALLGVAGLAALVRFRRR
ncbi:MAG: PEP-CTERM sorting domain-containing protein [Verrucomicrobia bacterium]|nr:PEP-CTERM sorting domain-containing protein [Verrucomicrobiota bacterium]